MERTDTASHEQKKKRKKGSDRKSVVRQEERATLLEEDEALVLAMIPETAHSPPKLILGELLNTTPSPEPPRNCQLLYKVFPSDYLDV